MSADELDRRERQRYWEIYLTDDLVLSALDAQVAESIRAARSEDLSAAVSEYFQRQYGYDELILIRAAGELWQAAFAIEDFQAVLERRVLEVGRRVARAAARESVGFHVTAEVGLNASVPIKFGSNDVYVGPELIVATASDDELACVLGHELAHLTEGHTTAGSWAKVGKGVVTGLVAVAAATAMAYGNYGAPLSQSQIDAALTLGQGTSFLLADVPLRLAGWGRAQEREADAMGLHYAREAGFEPDACAGYMLTMAQREVSAGESGPPAWWRTHPVTLDRVIALRELADRARRGRLLPAE